ncbi:phosphotransferase family protein [Sphingobium sp. 3R8]|uniref:phosphotransferase family protein n=1 Tax=Sphingobium sp. 3R8 TaxID=2874921 RepID=UPI001CCB1DA8|nr:phosphotransferase family protein [Sphingobium sp. 3R8]MBZ9646869.1 phosphotransferase family protein [Sphingobium sp. 3R8]
MRAAVIDDPVNLDVLTRWMDEQALGSGPIGDVRMLAGGTQNILMMFTRGSRCFVLRRPPARPREGNNETMRREARILAALSDSDVPHPRLIAACGDESVLGAAFYLMEPVDGFNPVVGLPALHAGDPAIRRAMGFALVESAAALGQLDYLAVGLEDFGKPDNFLRRQVDRWQRQLDGYEAMAGWPGPDALPGVRDIGRYISERCPGSFRPGIIHGDYSVANVMFRNDGPELAAIVDWELSTIGDPLIDLGWIVATWRGSGGPDLPVLIVEPFDGFPTADELVERYAQRSGRDVVAIDWYVVLACYKLGIILEGSYARACAGLISMETGISLHDTATKLMQRALHRIG